MIPSHRQRFNRDFSDAKYARFLALLEAALRRARRRSATAKRPCFLPGGPDRQDGALRPRNGGATARQSAISAGLRARRFPPSTASPRRRRAALRAGRFRPRRGSASRSWWRSRASPRSTPISPCWPSPTARPTESTRALQRAARWPRRRRVPRPAARGDRGRSRSGERDPARDRPRAPEDASRFPADRAGLRRAHRRYRAPSSSRAIDSSTTRRRAHVPIERIYNRAIVDELVRKQIPHGLRFPRRPGRGMGRPSQLVFPPQQILAALPAIIRRFRARTSCDRVARVERPRALRAQAALLVRRRRRDRGAHRGANRRRPGGAAQPVHPAGARRFPAR